MRTYEEKEPEKKKKPARRKNTDSLTAAGYDLFEELRKLRLEIAREESLPPYIIFNDKTLIDMCVKLPKDEHDLLQVSGVGESKLKKYGKRFLSAVKAFTDEHSDMIMSMQVKDEGMENGEKAESLKPARPKKKGKTKTAFCLSEDNADEFIYQDLYYISEIKDELNRICTMDSVKKVTTNVIGEYLISEGLVYEDGTNGVFVKLPTEKGLQYGIKIEEKLNQVGVSYKVVKYPPKVQKMIVDYFAYLSLYSLGE